MTALNEIKYDNRKVNKRKTLFSKLLEVIADMLGININEDSLLAAARDAYKAIKKMPKENNQEAIQGTFQFEEETASTEQTENPNEDNSQDYTPETKDNDFTWKDFQARNNNELVAVYGNFVNPCPATHQEVFRWCSTRCR